MADSVRIGALTERYTSAGRLSGYQVEIWHDGLNEHKVIRDRYDDILENKVHAQIQKWDDKWTRKRAQDEKRERREQGLAGAEEATREAESALEECGRILAHTLDVDDRINWNALKDSARFTQAPSEPSTFRYDDSSGRPTGIVPIQRPYEPDQSSDEFDPGLSLLDSLFGGRKRRKLEAANAKFAAARQQWVDANAEIDTRERALNRRLDSLVASYDASEAEFLERQREANRRVDEMRERYITNGASSSEVMEEHAGLVLDSSEYPDWHSTEFDIEFNVTNQIMVVDFNLPPKDKIPTLKQVTYVASRDAMRESHQSASAVNKMFDDVCYQMGLRTIHELFEADEIQAISAVVFNGWVEAVDAATGSTNRSCIMSVQAERDEFLGINLAAVEPKACFNKLKGISAARLSGLTPIAPVLQIERDDSRIVESREVAANVHSGTNLAAMDWEEFEHLVRELFEKEFTEGGAEVRVTQASRDGGVDAVVIDPDPLRGGKTIIQAKRYSNTVDVSAVRDLYGTVMNEGANKGILVTTSDYGSDSYAFASDKPLILLNGNNVLALLEKHGQKARIDLQEARDIAREQRARD